MRRDAHFFTAQGREERLPTGAQFGGRRQVAISGHDRIVRRAHLEDDAVHLVVDERFERLCRKIDMGAGRIEPQVFRDVERRVEQRAVVRVVRRLDGHPIRHYRRARHHEHERADQEYEQAPANAGRAGGVIHRRLPRRSRIHVRSLMRTPAGSILVRSRETWTLDRVRGQLLVEREQALGDLCSRAEHATRPSEEQPRAATIRAASGRPACRAPLMRLPAASTVSPAIDQPAGGACGAAQQQRARAPRTRSRKRLGQVIVRTEIEAVHAIFDRITRREHEDVGHRAAARRRRRTSNPSTSGSLMSRTTRS